MTAKWYSVLPPPSLGTVVGPPWPDGTFSITGVAAELPCRRLLLEDIYDLLSGWKQVANDPRWIPREK